LRISLEAGIKAGATRKTNFVMTRRGDAFFEASWQLLKPGRAASTIASVSGGPREGRPYNGKRKMAA
jgi:hypothetical protein